MACDHRGKVALDRLGPVAHLLCMDRRVGLGQLRHGLPRRQPTNRGAGLSVIVLAAKQMQPDQIKSVAELPARRIGRVMGIDELAALVQHRSACSRASGKSVPVVAVRHRLVDPRQELLHGAGHIVDPAECTHNTLFRGGVLLLLGGALNSRLLIRAHRPAGYITPVECGEQSLAIHQGLVGKVEHVFAVAAHAGPIHHPAGFKRSTVKQLHRRVDNLGGPPGAGLVFLFADIIRQWQNYPKPGGFGCVFPCGVDGKSAAQSIADTDNSLGPAGLHIIEIQGNHPPGGHMSVAAQAIGQSAANKTANVLQPVLIPLGHGQIRLSAFLAADRLTQALIKLAQGALLYLPGPESGTRCGKADLFIILHCHTSFATSKMFLCYGNRKLLNLACPHRCAFTVSRLPNQREPANPVKQTSQGCVFRQIPSHFTGNPPPLRQRDTVSQGLVFRAVSWLVSLAFAVYPLSYVCPSVRIALQPFALSSYQAANNPGKYLSHYQRHVISASSPLCHAGWRCVTLLGVSGVLTVAFKQDRRPVVACREGW